MAELFVWAFLGHLIGDFLFQPKKMAIGKSSAGLKGFWVCSVHVLLYTLVVALMLGSRNPIVWLAIYVPHWIIDRWSLADKWNWLIEGRTFRSAFESKDQFREFDIAFTSVVYTVVDSTFHLLCLVVVIKYLI